MVAASLLSGCAQIAPVSVATPWMAATSTNEWNEYANDLIAKNAVGQVGALRSLAYLNLAIHNAMARAGSEKASSEGAVAGAASTVLVLMFPKDEAATAARLQREVLSIGQVGRPAFQTGVDLGRKVGDDVSAQARIDRVTQPWTGNLPAGDGKWASRAQPPTPPLAPGLAPHAHSS